MDNEVKDFKLDLSQMCWYMRGSITLDEMYQTSYEDREIIGKVIKKNLETAKKTGQPFF
jgi:hypothetical protein